MTTALVRSVTPDELDLIRRTLAEDATADELQLYLYDCHRQGVHPLDKLIHFTKRSGKYTPITSIDFMRQRAADSGEMAGSDDPVFESGVPGQPPLWATVTVYRMTHGQRFAYTATARWSEYKPDVNDFMWRKMPHTMLGKCAEALALRKGFPRQLAGLYAKEEMDQADGPKTGYVVEAPALPEKRENQAAATGETRGTPSDEGPDLGVDLPPGAVRIVRIDVTDTKNAHVKKYLLTCSDGETYSTIKTQLAALAEQLVQQRAAVYVESHATKWGLELDAIHRAPLTGTEVAETKWTPEELAEQGL